MTHPSVRVVPRALSVRAQDGGWCVWLGCRPHPGHCHPPSCREQLSGCVPCPTPHGACEDIMSASGEDTWAFAWNKGGMATAGAGSVVSLGALQGRGYCAHQEDPGQSGRRAWWSQVALGPRPGGGHQGWEAARLRGPHPGGEVMPARAGVASGWAWVCILHRVPLTCHAHSHAHAHMCTRTASVPGRGWGPTDSWAELKTFQLRSPTTALHPNGGPF